MLAGDDLKSLGHNSTAYVHLITEAMKLGFADRERYYGDPRFVDVPMGTLLSADYAKKRRRLIDRSKAVPEMPQPGNVPTMVGVPGDTSYACAVDAKGNVMSVTPSDSSWDGPVIPGLGFVPSTRGSELG